MFLIDAGKLNKSKTFRCDNDTSKMLQKNGFLPIGMDNDEFIFLLTDDLSAFLFQSRLAVK